MELRDVEIFLAVADELHFGRAAEKLHLTQARVSQSIKKQERAIGGLLFERTSRRVRLTPLGTRLREELRVGYDQIRHSLADARRTAQGTTGTLRIGVMGVLGNELRELVDQLTARHPGSAVTFSEIHFSDPFGALRSDDVDVQLLWLPVREPDLTVGPVVLTEGRVLAVAEDSDLAAREAVSLEDLGDHLVLDPGPAVPDYWAEAMIPLTTPAGRPVRRSPPARTFHEVMALVATGRIVCPLNAHVDRYYTYPGVAYRPIADAPVTEWALVWRTDREVPLIRALAEVGGQHGPRAL